MRYTIYCFNKSAPICCNNSIICAWRAISFLRQPHYSMQTSPKLTGLAWSRTSCICSVFMLHPPNLIQLRTHYRIKEQQRFQPRRARRSRRKSKTEFFVFVLFVSFVVNRSIKQFSSLSLPWQAGVRTIFPL